MLRDGLVRRQEVSVGSGAARQEQAEPRKVQILERDETMGDVLKRRTAKGLSGNK